ncbi:glycosyltransferase family 2 protein [Patescibacteria group bacterium]
MKVSIIISVYNESKYIRKCLESLLVQTFKEFEIIVIDDGSTDKSSEILADFLKQKKNIQFLKLKHGGPAIARNLGVDKSKGDILVFLDGDMYFEKDFLQTLVNPIVSKKAKGTYSTEEYVANWKNIWARCWNYNWNLKHKKRISLNSSDQQKDFRAILKEEFLKVGGFDNTGYTDTWSLAKKLGYKPKPTNAKYYHYNPSTLKEVYNQAKWIGKRKHKGGLLGKIFLIIKNTPLFSLILGFKKSVLYKEPCFVLFKIVYDFGYLLGLISLKQY